MASLPPDEIRRSRREGRPVRQTYEDPAGSGQQPLPPQQEQPPLPQDQPPQPPSKSGKRRSSHENGPGRKRRRGLIVTLSIVAVVGLLGGAGYWAVKTNLWGFMSTLSENYASNQAYGEVLVKVNSGDTGKTISNTLADAGVTKTPDAFYNYLIKNDNTPNISPGVYKMQKKMTSEAAYNALTSKTSKQTSSLVLPEGLTVAQTLSIISDSLSIPLTNLQAAVSTPSDYGVSSSTLEGWLFPATYTFSPGVTASDVISKLVTRARKALNDAQVPTDQQERILTIASIIQREARQKNDFYKVSRVIQNRLDQGMKLQMDSTAQYGVKEMDNGSVSSSADALTSNNPWNTYVIDGLPATPISNPGDLAIDAAMHPADGPWLYFVTVNLNTGETLFSSTSAEHDAAVQQWKNWCKANPDSGC